ncbi:JAB domain-containing protein/MitMem_reg domain-containing protein [Cephalotus follicularis]|uniref:Eukaryotic translation initiation factor 3 subunit F n=1 Tax=Cephalotus follicularis TaxID=3775 RepID=A0A1Q3AM10_CEPFO|nr:JAB domain-containing protein/MitMem_reg domain-containing protein [Cephalotus follicularis]
MAAGLNRDKPGSQIKANIYSQAHIQLKTKSNLNQFILESKLSNNPSSLCSLKILIIHQRMAAAIEHTVLQFAPSSAKISAKLHPLVLFNICDCYVRRRDQAERVIGTLLGSVLPDGTVDIRNSYAVPHNEFSDEVALDIDYHHNMLLSHQKVNPKEVIVGWYSTGLGVTGGSALIHEFYSREVPNPVHLTVDTGFRNGESTIRAYITVNLCLGDRQLAAQFQEIPLDFRMVEAERVGFDLLKSTMVDKLPTDLEGMEVSMHRLLALIDDVYLYVDNVVEGRVEPDNEIGRFIADTVASLPKFSPQAFDKLVNDNLQDRLLLVYLASITRTQLSLAEKLNTAAQIL